MKIETVLFSLAFISLFSCKKETIETPAPTLLYDISGSVSLYETGTSFAELFRGNGHQYLGLVNDGNEIYAVKQNNLTSFDTLVSMNIATPPASFTNHLALDLQLLELTLMEL